MEKNDANVEVVYPGGINQVIANKYLTYIILYPLISYIIMSNTSKIIEVKKIPAVLVVPSFPIPAVTVPIINTWLGETPCRSSESQ